MENWSAHQLYKFAKPGLGESKTRELVTYSNALRESGLPVIFSLNHLAQITGARYDVLHKTVDRKREASNYRMYAIAKRSGGRRWIHSVASPLFEVQSFINKEILQRCSPHSNSYAFHASGGIRSCANVHCGARWLFQFDLSDFFYSISEVECYQVFSSLGYKPLLAFELARLCTTTRLPRGIQSPVQRQVEISRWSGNTLERIAPVPMPGFPYHERNRLLGVLPQGAPSSPMLANLSALSLDKQLSQFAYQHGLTYSRYADDLTLSCVELKCSRSQIRSNVIRIIKRSGFFENRKKIRIAGPGSRKAVLGLLVDGDSPRISKAMYKRVDRFLYGAFKFGFRSTAAHFRFDSAYGFHNHLSGLVTFVKSVDMRRWLEFSQRLNAAKLKWKDE